MSLTWTRMCLKCGTTRGVWPNQPSEPQDVGPFDCWECDADDVPYAWVSRPFERYMRATGFSTSESDFTPHYNRSFGTRVRSLAHMKALQERHGTSDMVVQGDAAEKFVPRDIARRTKHHREVAEKLATDGKLTPARGVEASYAKVEDA